MGLVLCCIGGLVLCGAYLLAARLLISDLVDVLAARLLISALVGVLATSPILVVFTFAFHGSRVAAQCLAVLVGSVPTGAPYNCTNVSYEVTRQLLCDSRVVVLKAC